MTAVVSTPPKMPLDAYPIAQNPPQGKAVENAVMAIFTAQAILSRIGVDVHQRMYGSVDELQKNSKENQKVLHNQAYFLIVCGVLGGALEIAGSAVTVPELQAATNPRLHGNAGLSDAVKVVVDKLKDPKFIQGICKGGAAITNQVGGAGSMIYKSREVEIEMRGKIQENVIFRNTQTIDQALQQHDQALANTTSSMVQLLSKEHRLFKMLSLAQRDLSCARGLFDPK